MTSDQLTFFRRVDEYQLHVLDTHVLKFNILNLIILKIYILFYIVKFEIFRVFKTSFADESLSLTNSTVN